MARKLEFDVELTLRKAMKLFWKNGFESTSMQDLVDELGINRFSIYNSFGDKRVLFLQSLEYYRQSVLAFLIEPLSDEGSAFERLDRYLSRFSEQLQSGSGVLGCMIQNTSLSGISQDEEVSAMLINIFSDLKTALVKVITEGQQAGELISGEEASLLADQLLCHLQGLIILRKTLQDRSMIEPQVILMRSMIAGW